MFKPLPLLLWVCWLMACTTQVAPNTPLSPTATHPPPPPTIALTPLPPSEIEAGQSPDGQWFAAMDPTCSTALVFSADRQRVAQLSELNTLCTHPWGWTSDSRFAIFGSRHPKGNATTDIFDVQQWRWILKTPGCPIHSSGGYLGWDACGEYPAALSPTAPRLLLENGFLLTLPEVSQTDLIPELRTGPVSIVSASLGKYLARWSPDGAYLAFVTILYLQPGYSEAEHTLYLAQGDGSAVQPVTLLEGYPRSLQWVNDGTTVMVTTSADSIATGATYFLNVTTGQVQVTPGPAVATPFPTFTSGPPTLAPTLTPILTPP